MKKRLVLFALPLVAMAITGCNKKDKGNEPSGDGDGDGTPTVQPLPNEYSLMKNWAANPSEEVYNVLETETETKISYTDAVGEKSGGWEYVARSFAFDAQYIARFSEYKKISFTGKLAVTSGSNVVMIKVEGDATNTYEAKFNFGAEPATYELPLSFVSDWTKVNSLLFFVDRETSESGSGMMTFTKFVLSKEEVNPAYNIASNMPAVPQDWNYYKGGDEFNVTYRWGYDTSNTITTAEEQDAIAKFSWNGKSAEWAYVSALAKGDATHALKESGFKRIAFKVVGTENAEVMFKFQTRDNTKNKEVSKVMTGAEQIIEVDVTAVLAAANDSDEYLVAIFPAPGATGNDKVGQLVLKEAKFDKTEVTPDIVTNKVDFTQVYIDNIERKDACFAVAKEGHVQTITLDKQAVGWESIAYKLEKMDNSFNLANYTVLSAKITSDKATHVLLKAYNSIEKWFELTAGTPVVVNEVLDLSSADLTQSFIFFASTNEGDALDAVITVEHLKLIKPAALNVGNVDEYLIDHVNASGEYACDDSAADAFTINYTKTATGWAYMETLIGFDIDHLDSIKGEVVSTVATHVIIKPADLGANEMSFNLAAGVAQKFDKKLTANGAWTGKFLIFIAYEGGDALTGAVTFSGMKLYASSKVTNIGDYGSVRIEKFYRADACYNPVTNPNTGAISVAYNKESAGGWDSMAAKVELGDAGWNFADYTRVHAILEADVNVKVLLKAYNAVERWVDLVAGVEQVVEFTATALQANGADFIVFICAGDNNPGEKQGTVVIKGLALLRAATNAASSDGNVYVNNMVQGAGHITVQKTDNEKGMVVEYTKDAVGFGEFMEFFISAHDIMKYNHITVTATATNHTHIMFKPCDSNPNERTFDLPAGTPVDIDFTYSPTNANWSCKQVMFFSTIDGDALAGTITLANFTYSIA